MKANAKWQELDLRSKEMSASQVKHPTSGSVLSAEATVTMEHQTFLMEALEQFLTQTPPTHVTPPRISPPTHNLSLFLRAPQTSIFDHCSLLTDLSSSARLCSPSATFLTPPERPSGPFPIMHCSPQHSELGSPLITNITPLSLYCISRRHHSAFSLYFGGILTLTFHILQSSFNTAHSFPELV